MCPSDFRWRILVTAACRKLASGVSNYIRFFVEVQLDFYGCLKYLQINFENI